MFSVGDRQNPPRLSWWGVLGLAIAITGVQASLSPTTATEQLAQITPTVGIERPLVQLGSQGSEVSELQAALKLLGYYSGAVNGIYDQPTADAVARFQQAAGLNPDGIVDARTWEQLFPQSLPNPTANPCLCSPEATSPQDSASSASGDLPILRLGMRGTAVLGLQQRLQAQGFFQGRLDGVFGSDTQVAVEAAQRDYNLEPDGVVGPATWEVLMR